MLTRYKVRVDNFPKIGSTLLYSTVHGTAVVCPAEVIDVLESNINECPPIPDRTLEVLERDFLFENKEDDTKHFIDWMQSRKERKDIFSVTLVMTTNCNFQCEYCYQRKVFKEHMTMGDTELEQISKWLENKLDKINPKSLYVHLFGGEPLLNWRMIPKTLEQIDSITKARNVKLFSFLITNGALLTEDVSKKLAELSVSSIQVSLDGVGEIQDVRRKSKNGKPTYNIILENILKAVNHIFIDLRINVDRHNVKYIPHLMRELSNCGLQYHPNFGLNLEFVSPITYPTEFSNRNTFNLDSGETELLNLWKKQYELGFSVSGHMPTEGACEQMIVESVAIMPNGKIFCCGGFLGKKQFIIGDISKDEYTPRYEELFLANPWTKCLDCPYAPLCQGGCRMCAYVNSEGDYSGLYCRKEFFDRCFPEFLRYKFYSQMKMR